MRDYEVKAGEWIAITLALVAVGFLIRFGWFLAGITVDLILGIF